MSPADIRIKHLHIWQFVNNNSTVTENYLTSSTHIDCIKTARINCP